MMAMSQSPAILQDDLLYCIMKQMLSTDFSLLLPVLLLSITDPYSYAKYTELALYMVTVATILYCFH